jgi:endoglucanase
MKLDKHLIELSGTAGVSGYEHDVRDLVARTWKPLADDLHVDALGNVIATVHGKGKEPRPRILVTAHMDEIGLMVTKIEDRFLRVISVGGIDMRTLPGQPVIVHGTKPLPGVIGTRPPHVLSAADRKKYPDYDSLVVDVGLPARQVERSVQVGDIVTFGVEAMPLSKGLVTGKAMDNRASVACMTRLLELLKHRMQQWDVLVAATVQEEVGLKGGYTAAWHTEPDLAIVVDTSWAIGVGVGDDKGFKLGDGPTLIIGPDTHPTLFRMVRKVARDQEIKLTPELAPVSSGTEGAAVYISRDGVPTAIIGLPIRNMHTPVEIASVKDIERAARIIAAFIETLDDSTLDQVWLDGEDETNDDA